MVAEEFREEIGVNFICLDGSNKLLVDIGMTRLAETNISIRERHLLKSKET